ncbi:MAG: TerB family tellurite resistance protein [Azospirillaceae bacterium]
MLNRIRSFLIEGEAETRSGEDGHSLDELQVAAAALLMEAARMDDSIDPDERDRIEALVRWRFGLTEEEAALVVAEAERVSHGATQWHGFAETIRAGFDDRERVRLLEMLWDVVYADGRLHDLEASLMRRVAGLLYVSDQDSGAARKRAMARHGLDPGEAGSNGG